MTSYGRRRLDESRRLAAALAVRIGEILPPEEFKVVANDSFVRVEGVGIRLGQTFGATPAGLWLLPLPSATRLGSFLERTGRNLQQFLTNTYGSPWPRPDAEVHVRMTNDTIYVWWGDRTEADAPVRLRPIPRTLE